MNSPCPQCGAPVPNPTTTGQRRRIYCGARCRRLSEFEIRAQSRILERLLEEQTREASDTSPLQLRDAGGRDQAARLRDLATAIATTRARLRALCESDADAQGDPDA